MEKLVAGHLAHVEAVTHVEAITPHAGGSFNPFTQNI